MSLTAAEFSGCVSSCCRSKLRIVRFRIHAKAHSLRCSSSPNRTRCAGLRFGFGCRPKSCASKVFALSTSRTSYRSRRLFILKSHRSFAPSLLLSNRDSLRWIRGWVWVRGGKSMPQKRSRLCSKKPPASRRFLLHRKPYKDSERGQDSLVRRISPVSLRSWRMEAWTTGHRSRICLTCAADRCQAPLGLRDIAAACGIGKARHVLRVPKEVPARLKPMRPFTFSAPANWRRPWTGPPGGTSRRAASA